jgi:CO/xanthine dehydrogenase FAD-binding subunit
VKPAPFTYHDPQSLGDALDLLARLDNGAIVAATLDAARRIRERA